uniref:Complement component c3b, tandem duplicate 1 n=1 Tax=Myripristis murdjan TaxID=586833 RepID=A0A667WKL1_9TELE
PLLAEIFYLLRADSQENIYLEASGLSTSVPVSISILDFSKATLLLQDSATLNPENNFHTLKTIELTSELLNRDDTKNKFVYLKVTFEGYHSEERILMVSFHRGYIFIQTDKPIYNPGDTVRCRALVSSPSFKAFDSSITVEFQNPDGVVVKQTARTRAIDGVFPDTFVLSEIVNEGTWKVIAKFDHWPQNTFSSQFEVKKYVLPAFNVTLTPKKSYLKLDDTELEVEISAKYLYGEPVQGKAYVVFGVQTNNEMRRLPTVKHVSDVDGGVVKLSMDEIRSAYPNIRSVVGSSVYVKASVLTNSGSDLVEAEKTGIKIVESPYVLSFRDMPKFFKPGMPFDFTIQVSHHDGSPARNVKVQLNLMDVPLLVSSGKTRATVNMAAELRPQIISAETTGGNLSPEQQARYQSTVQPYMPQSTSEQNYLYISTGTNTVSAGDSLAVTMTIKTGELALREFIKHLTYLVINKGKIIVAKRMDVSSQVISSVALAVTKEMMPSFRILAFYKVPWAGRDEVVADSIWVDVDDSCVGGLNVGPADDRYREYSPGKQLRFKVRGDPGAKVNLVAVDNAVYLLSRERLTQSKIWDVVEKGDIGCTRGGGQNSMKVFSDAGLLFSSSSGVKSDTRQALQCPASARRRRSAELLERRARLESHYKEKLLRRCCKDGLREIPMPYSCTRRSLYITEGWECIRAFRYCCAHYRDQEFDTRRPTTPPPLTTPLPLTTTLPPVSIHPFMRPPGLPGLPGPPGPPGAAGRVALAREIPQPDLVYQYARVIPRFEEDPVTAHLDDDDDEYLDETQVYLRSKFYESWLWKDVNLPAVADRGDGLASLNVDSVLPDSITEWGVLAISASPDTGFCVAEPYNVKAWKHFFVDLKLPYSVARMEQIEIKAVIHNYDSQEMRVTVVLMKTEGMCSIAFNERHTQKVTVPAGSSVVVPYTIVPLVVGKLPVQVMVVAGDSMGQDRIQKTLRVVVERLHPVAVFPPAAGTQVVRYPRVELESVVPNSHPETYVNLRGNLLADSIDNAISDDSLASLIRMPGGCVEQNLASITLPLIATLYLERSEDWESVGVERKAEALRYIRRGYENQLAYRKSDGSYPPYRNQGSSTWITAYVVKVFSMAHSLVGIDEKQVCDALIFLLKNKQMSMGHFKEDNPVYSTTMTGGLRGKEAETTLTAFVLIALAEAREAGINSVPGQGQASIRKTADYLKRALTRPLRRPYTVAISSYAMALIGKDAHFNPVLPLLAAASPDKSRWHDSENHLFTLEATGYALLALVKLGRMEEAAAPFKWLNDQRRRGGGFGSTQPTMVVLQALSEYLINNPPPLDLSLHVDVRVPGRSDLRYHFEPKTSYVARSSKVPLDKEFEVEARGNGQGILEVVTYYNQLHEVDEKMPCNNFELSVAIAESSEKPPADVEKSYEITIKVRALGPMDVRMVVLDISLPTGFTPDNSDLEMLSNSVDRYVSNFQIVDNLSDRGSLILHLFKVSHKEPEILIFKLQQSFKVGLLQPSPVTVYEYYNPDHRCSRTYTPSEDKDELAQICRDDVCRCTQGDCCVTKDDSQNFPDKARETFACQTLHHGIKKSSVEAGVAAGQKRFFMSHGSCREGLNMQVGSEYLIMGPEEDQWTIDSDTNRFIYILSKNTWVERWPSSAECSSNPSLRAKCIGLEQAAYELSFNACRV